MDYFDSLTQQRIDSPTSDLIDALLARYVSSLTPCNHSLYTVWQQIQQRYPLSILPSNSIHHARTALAAIETYYPDDAAYLPFDPDERLRAAQDMAHALHLEIFCAEILDEGAGHSLYLHQKAQFEQRSAGFGLTWTHMPVRICMECCTGYCLVSGSDQLSDQITLWRGISQTDIDDRTPGLIAYLRAKYAIEDV